MDKPKIYHSTGIMNKLRDKMPYIIIFLILAFVATIVFEWGMNYLGIQGGGQQVFANINGKEITYQQYEQLLQQNLEQMRQQNGGKDIDEATMDQIREQVWQSLVQQTLTSQEIERLGIKVSDAEILDWIYNRPENLPDAIKKNFMDSTGVFNVDFYQQALGMKTKEAVNFWNEVEKYLREVLLAEKLQTQITATINVTEGDILQKYRDDNIKANFQFAFLDLNSAIDTNLIAVTDADMKKYYEEHKDEFKQLEAVKFKYVTFSDAPTIDDSNSVKKGLEFVIRDMKEAKLEDSSLIRLVNDNSSVPFNNAFQKSSAFGKGALNFLFGAKNGDISPLIIDADAYKVIKLLDTKDGEDNYVNAAHILINFGADTAGAKKRAEDILARAKKGEDFTKLAVENSEDPSAKQNSGDLGWFMKGSMVKEFEDACMNAAPGSVVGVIKTQFGFHIINVKGKSKKEFRVAEVRKTVTAGQRTKDIARKRAQEFIADVDNGAIMDSLAKHMQIGIFSTPEISNDGNVPGAGQNKNLIKFGLANGKGKMYGPVKMQGGYGVYQITQKISAGYKNFDSVKTMMIKPKIQVEKRLAFLMKTAEEMKGKIAGGDLMSLQTQYPMYVFGTADSCSVSKPDPKIGLEYNLFNTIYSMKPGEISAPIKGQRGVFLVKLNWIMPFDQNNYNLKYAEIRKSLLDIKKQNAVQEWMQSLTQRAEIEDNREKFL